jgi:ADP-ribosyl-[dinitrogen reductase] hydrolase
MLIELAVGDAYGAGFEYVKPPVVARGNDLSRYVQHPRHKLRPGCYTDDTQMSLAIAELVAAGPGTSWTREVLADKFVEVFRRDPREGYSQRFYGLLLRLEDGAQLLREIEPTSDKSGAAMRAAPIGVVPSLGRVIQMARIQAAVTHDTTDGINAAVAAALMAHYFVYDLGPREELGFFLEQHVAGPWSAPWIGPVGEKGWMSVRAAVTAVTTHDSLRAILRECVAFTGDVDTVAAIALAAAAHCPEVAQDLPPHLVDELENGAYGRDYLAALDARLLAVARES